MELSNKRALVTGATGGIGSEAARLLAAQGAEVVVSGRDAGRGEATVRSITDAGGRARFVAADLTDLASLRRLADAAGEVDILVNNAAIFPGAPTVDQDVDTFDTALAANVRAPYFLTAALAPAMVAKGAGSIVNVSTMAARIGMPGLSVYSATKAALESLTRTWAAEFSPAGVRVNAVAPGPTRTDMVLDTVGEEGAEQFAKTTLLGRLATPREIAEVILFLATDRSAYLTGATVAADAGRTAV
ncbi:SDR family oxidoreductase [Streptomyces coacervatus]|uniref:SDR family oxidoreductase n=1 Tax=Streptomyces coacervatus TaxID=647381 RepID=A0ABP7JB66_9ACTN|nr:SDR family oxidoreductase [Streptomyces coacervatus]MDF2271939.1 SDR family NAD(P)-dependent oxidoreductase [Streptomyces coacervatus]